MKPVPLILLTGFEPFGGDNINPSWEAVKHLDGELICRHRIKAIRLPCVFHESLAVLTEAIDRHEPVLVLCVGQAGGRSELTLERIGINIDDARIADNRGNQPIDTPVNASAPAAYFSTLPIKAMVKSLREAGIPASISNSAGTFVCNHVLFGLLHQLADISECRAGFLHIPFAPEQVISHPGNPSMALETVIHGLRLMLATAATTATDIHESAGVTH
ncbi:pyroglutamyl-peptidase I [Shewanella sp. JM162201]|uniref:Pyrrolidone-carboxylate peptidase n=1 Tax=Shewanella jiangmenensis TaxID=2837387 RepID=A0ABS5VB42_9GAMM|nr:pyroglutamyl-peptidase I [Shewanella jiangmenensis]MBT1446248.1 pyroglutamyl-peptidase I [Shewanella jiangmenensis]